MNKQPESPLYQRFNLQLQHRIEPHPDIKDNDIRQQIRVLSALLLLCLVCVALSGLMQPGVTTTIAPQDRIMTAVNFFWLLGCYLLSRSPYARLAPALVIAGAILSIFAYGVIFNRHETAFIFNFLVIVTLSTTLMMSVKTAFFIAVLTMIGMLLADILVATTYSLQHELLFNGIANILILILAYLRQQDANRIINNEQRLRSLMEANLEAIVFFDENGLILDVNQAFIKITGFQLEDVCGTPVLKLLAQRSYPHAMARWENNQTEPFRAVVRHQNGSHLHMEIQILSRKYDQQAAYAVVGRDISEQLIVEQRGKEHEQSYQTLFKQTSDAVFIMDLDGVYLNVNEKAGEMLHCSPSDIIGESIETFIPPGEHEKVIGALRRVLDGESVSIYTRRFKRPNGTFFPAEVNVMLVHNAEGDPLYVQSLVRDISHREKEATHKFELALQRERTGILRNFINDASHHFRTPLANIKTGVYLLSKIQDNPQKKAQQLDMMRLQVARMEQLINDLLTVIRLDDGETGFRRETIPVNTLLKRLMDTIHARDWHNKHQWTQLDCTHNSLIAGDSSYLLQAILNLVKNAIEHTPEGGEIRLQAHTVDREVIIEVIDTGKGIPAASLEHIFQNFYQSDTTLSGDYSSNGMGLPISQKIIQLHGGTILVESEENAGSCFRVILPVAAPIQSSVPAFTFQQTDDEINKAPEKADA